MANFGQNNKSNLNEIKITPVSGDSHWADVSLYLPFNSGVSGDLSLNGHATDYSGAANINTGSYKCGDAGLQLENSGFLEVGGPNYNFDFNSGDFTIEGWFNLPETGSRMSLVSNRNWGLSISPIGKMMTPKTIIINKLGQVFRETFHGTDYITIEKNGSDVASFNQYVSVNGDDVTPVFYPYIGDYSNYYLTGSVTGAGGVVNPYVEISVSEGDKITIKSSHHGKIDDSTWKKIFSGVGIHDGGVNVHESILPDVRTHGPTATILQDYTVRLDPYTPSEPNLHFSYYTGDYVSVKANIKPTGLNEWHHFAAERSGANIYLYNNGTPIETGIISASTRIGDYADINLLVGAEPFSITDSTPTGYLAKNNLTGSIDNLRITKGVSRYGGQSFSPSCYKTGEGNANKFLHIELPSSGIVLRDKTKEERLSKAWATFDGTRGLISEPAIMKNSYNIREIEDMGDYSAVSTYHKGRVYKLHFINNFNNTNYIVNSSCNLAGVIVNIAEKNESWVMISCTDANGNPAKPSIIDVIIY